MDLLPMESCGWAHLDGERREMEAARLESAVAYPWDGLRRLGPAWPWLEEVSRCSGILSSISSYRHVRGSNVEDPP